MERNFLVRNKFFIIALLASSFLIVPKIEAETDLMSNVTKEGSEQSVFAVLIRAKEEKNYSKAIEEYKQILSQDKKDATYARAAFCLGCVYYLQDNYQQALDEFQRFSQTFPVNPSEYRKDMVMGHLDVDNCPGCLDFTVLENYSVSSLVLLAKVLTGEIHWQQKRKLDSLNQFNHILEKYADSPVSTYALFETAVIEMDQGKKDAALAVMQKIASRSPSLAWKVKALFYLGDYYADNNDLRKAINEYQKVVNVAVEPSYKAYAQFLIGKCYRKEGKIKEAIAAFQKIVDDYPDTEGGWARTARLEISDIKQVEIIKKVKEKNMEKTTFIMTGEQK